MKIAYVLLALLFLEPALYAYNGYYSRQARSVSRQARSINCRECCSQRRFVSEECLRNCNGCQQYNDASAAEGRDYP